MHALIFGSQLVFSWFLVLVCVITIITKFFLYLYTKLASKEFDNILIKANMADHRNDCIITIFTLLSALFSLKGWLFIDSIVGIGISVWIGFTGIKFLIESFNVLMDISVDENTMDLILDIANSYSDIKKINDVRSTPVGYRYIIFITISVDGNMKTFDSHKLADSLELDINKLDKVYNTFVHVEPV